MADNQRIDLLPEPLAQEAQFILDSQPFSKTTRQADSTESVGTEKMNKSGIERDADSDDEWQVYVGDRGGVGWQTTDGERRVYDDLPPGGIESVDTDQLQDFVEFAGDVDEQERLVAYAEIGLIADASGPEPAQPTEQGNPRVEVGNIAEASERVRQAPAPPSHEFVDNWVPVTDSVVEGTIVELADGDKFANDLPGDGEKAIVTDLPSEGGQDGTAVLADGTSVDITLEDGVFEGTHEIIQAYHDPANQVANGDSEWSDFPLGKIPEPRQSELGFEDGVDIDAVSTDERLSNVFDAAAKRTNARDYGIRGGNTTGAEMDVFEYEDGSIDFGVPAKAYDNITTGVVDSVEEAVRNNRDSPKVIEAFGGNTCETAIVESPEGASYIVKEGLSGQTLEDYTDENRFNNTGVQESAIETIAASYFVGNGDLHYKNLFVTDFGEVAVIDHDDGPSVSVEQAEDLHFIRNRMPNHEIRKQVSDMAVEYATGSRDVPDDISDEHADYIERAVEEAIVTAHDQPGYTVPEEVRPDFPPKYDEPVVDSFAGFDERDDVVVEHPETGIAVDGFVSRIIGSDVGNADGIEVHLEAGARVRILDPDLVFDAPVDARKMDSTRLERETTASQSDTEWLPYFGDRGGVGWQTEDGERREYGNLPPGGADAINEEALAEFFDRYTDTESERNQMRDLLNIDEPILSDTDESDTQDSITPEQAVERFQDTIESTIDFSNRSDVRTDEELSATVWDASLDAVSAGADPETVVTGLRDRLEETESITDTFGADYIIESFVYDHFDPLADSDAPDQQLVREMRGYAENPSEYPDVDVQTESGSFDTTATDLRDEIADVMADEQYKARNLRYDRGQEIFNTIEEHIASGGDPSQAVLALASAYDSNTLDAKTPDDVSRSLFRNFTEEDVSTDAEQALFDELRQFDRIPESYPTEVSDIEQTIVDELFALAQDERDISGRPNVFDVSWFDVSRGDLDGTVAGLLEETDNTDAIVSVIEDTLAEADNESDRARFYHSVTEEIGGRETEFGEATLLAANKSEAFRNIETTRKEDVLTDDQQREWEVIRSEWFFSVYSEDTAPLFKLAAEQTGNIQVPTDDPDVYNVLEGESVDEIDTALFDTAIEYTRDVLREVYGDSVPCYRGLSPEGEPSDAGSTDISRQIEEAAESGKAAEVDHRTLESWSVNPLHARNFAGASEDEDDGIIIKTEIPIEEILIASYAGFLTGSEDEIVAAQSEAGTYAPEQVLTGDEIRAGGDAVELLEQAQRLAQDETPTPMKADPNTAVEIEIADLPPVNWLQTIETDLSADTGAEKSQHESVGVQTAIHSMYPELVEPADVSVETVSIEEDLLAPFARDTQRQVMAGLAFAETVGLLDEPERVQSASIDGQHVLGQYDHRDKSLTIDVATDQQRVNEQMGYSTVDTVADLVVHEMVHAGHSGEMREIIARHDDINSFTEFYNEILDNERFQSHTAEITEDVSEYAAEDAAEFVAEVALDRLKGRDMPAYISSIYDELAGPELNRSELKE